MTKKLYITTAIPYVNANPHIGNALDYLLADIWARYQRQNGHNVRFQAGTDEHGNKIAMKAEENKQTAQAYVDSMYGSFEALIKMLNIEATDFIRTSDPNHMKRVQMIWEKLKPYIYKGKYEGWYCTGCESFVTDKEATENGGVCPDHNKPYERLSEENYYFKMSAFSDKIREQIDKKEFEIYPEFRKKEFLNLLDSGLQDVSISRPKKHLSWGVPVPGDDSQIIYVWVDALPNYITVLGYPDTDLWKEYWPADVQVIGKDILRFHAAIWPAILLALDMSLPKKLLVHGHINSGGGKMSKKLGNVVSPQEIAAEYGIDAFRYFFSRHIPTLDDGDFTWEKFEAAYNNELGNELGNLVQRVASMVTRYQDGVIGDLPQPEHDIQAYREHMDSLHFNKAFDDVWGKVRSINAYIEKVKPWEIAAKRGKDADAEDHLGEVLSYATGSLVQIADLITPFLPHTAQVIKNTFESGVIKQPEGVLFPKIYNHTKAPVRK